MGKLTEYPHVSRTSDAAAAELAVPDVEIKDIPTSGGNRPQAE